MRIDMKSKSNMCRWKILFSLFSVLLFNRLDVLGQLLGPAKVSMDKITECENPQNYPNRMKTSLKRINDTFYTLDFDINFKNNIDSTTGIYINIARKFGENYIPNIAIIWERDICAFGFKNANSTLNNILNQMEKPPRCPVDSGSYKVRSIGLDLSGIPRVLLYGKFRADVTWIQKSINIFCQQIYATSSPSNGSK